MTKTLSVYLVGEGPTDIGGLSSPPPYRDGSEGFMQPVLRKLGGGRRRLRFHGSKVTSLPKKRIFTTDAGHRRKASQALALACQEGADILVFVKDVDKTAGHRATNKEARRRVRDMRGEIEEGFEGARSAIDKSKSVRTFVATPCRMIEAWAMGDGRATACYAGCRQEDVPSNPEMLWGNRSDPASNNPKCVLQRMLGRDPTRQDFAEIAERSRPDEIARSCPLSFKPLCDSVRQAISDCRAQVNTAPLDFP